MSTILYNLGHNTITETVPNGMEDTVITQYPASMSLYRLVKRELLNRRPGGGGRARVCQAIIREVVNYSMRNLEFTMDSWDKQQQSLNWQDTFRNDRVVLMKGDAVIFESKGEL